MCVTPIHEHFFKSQFGCLTILAIHTTFSLCVFLTISIFYIVIVFTISNPDTEPFIDKSIDQNLSCREYIFVLPNYRVVSYHTQDITFISIKSRF